MFDNRDLRKKVVSAPVQPGVYLISDASGTVIYVGKAKSLRKRLSSYFSSRLSDKTAALMEKAADINCRVCASETMALLLEASLVHDLQPRYNVLLRDDKSFLYLCITEEKFPRIFLARAKETSGKIFGPYTNTKLLKAALKVVRRAFAFRTCKVLPKKPCIYYRIKLCPGVCCSKISADDYARTMQNISLVLEGKIDDLLKRLNLLMQEKSKKLDFESAAIIRDQLDALGVLAKSHYPVSGASGRPEEVLKNLLGLKNIPRRIEGFDISNISGSLAVGSMVSFFDGKADKNNYRRFRIKDVPGPDDYSMIAEVVRRRYGRLLKEKAKLPDLILIDGGKGHLLTAFRQLKQLGVAIPLISIAKKEENIYIIGRDKPLRFSQDTAALNLIRRIRDEAHRFAISYHHLLRRKRVFGK
ncbi:MAG: excinuclease ABC subunit UvrC [Candidatus Omnitrophica bacterium]|jgi:excinuclease ABC subunit C|nr:excinuclease ABC subunit UvrC [Candidatus Omnitrophota bacterium]